MKAEVSKMGHFLATRRLGTVQHSGTGGSIVVEGGMAEGLGRGERVKGETEKGLAFTTGKLFFSHFSWGCGQHWPGCPNFH